MSAPTVKHGLRVRTDAERLDFAEHVGIHARWTELDASGTSPWTIYQTVGNPPVVLGEGSTLRAALDDAIDRWPTPTSPVPEKKT